ncbi:hypothetical protein ACFX10_027736 [Malus domestica]
MYFQHTLSSHSVFLIPWDTPANNPSRAKVFHIIMVESKRHGEIALEYSSSTADVLPKKLPHLPEEQIRQAKMIPAACGDNVQKKQAEKNAACTINPAQGVRAEELEKLPHLLGEQIRNCNITPFKSKAVESQQDQLSPKPHLRS